MAKRQRNSKGRFIKGGGGGRKHKRKSKSSRSRRRRAVPVRIVTAPRRHRRRRHARAAAAAAPRRRRRRHHVRAAAAESRYRRRRRHSRRNPFSGAELAFSIGTGVLGYIGADLVDRFLATYDPAAYGASGASLPTDRFTGGNGTQANTLNIAAQPSMLRLGAAIGMAALPLFGASMIKNSMAKSAAQGFGLGAAIKAGVLVWNGYIVPKVFMPPAGTNPTQTSSFGLRVYPAELVAAENLAASPQGGINGQGFNPGLARRPAPAVAPQRAPAMLGAAPADVGPVAQPARAPATAGAPAAAAPPAAKPAPSAPLPPYLGFASQP